MGEPVIVAASRTAIGTFGGALKDVEAHRLAARIIDSLMVQTGASPDELDEVIMGSIYQAGTGPNVSRQAAVAAGVPYEVPSMTVNKMCGSGLKAIGIAPQADRLDEASAIVAGGMENMSRAPYVVANARWGQRLGNGNLVRPAADGSHPRYRSGRCRSQSHGHRPGAGNPQVAGQVGNETGRYRPHRGQ